MDPSNYEEPISIKREFNAILSSATLTKQMSIALQETEFVTDSGFLLPSKSTQKYIGIDTLNTDVTK